MQLVMIATAIHSMENLLRSNCDIKGNGNSRGGMINIFSRDSWTSPEHKLSLSFSLCLSPSVSLVSVLLYFRALRKSHIPPFFLPVFFFATVSLSLLCLLALSLSVYVTVCLFVSLSVLLSFYLSFPLSFPSLSPSLCLLCLSCLFR